MRGEGGGGGGGTNSCLAGMNLRNIHGIPPSIVKRRLECNRPDSSTRRQSTSAFLTKGWASYLCQRDKVTSSQGNKYVHCCDSLAGMIEWRVLQSGTRHAFKRRQAKEGEERS
jgi:hypothetical protein